MFKDSNARFTSFADGAEIRVPDELSDSQVTEIKDRMIGKANSLSKEDKIVFAYAVFILKLLAKTTGRSLSMASLAEKASPVFVEKLKVVAPDHNDHFVERGVVKLIGQFYPATF